MARNAKTNTKTKRNSRKSAAVETVAKTVAVRGGGFAAITSNDRTIVVPASLESKRTNTLAAVGAPAAPLEAYLAEQRQAQSKLANGVESRQNPHSAKAVKDNRRNAKSSRAAKARGDAAAIAGKTPKAKKQGGRRGYDHDAKLTVLVKPKDSGLAAGSGRMAKLERAVKCKTVGDFLGTTVTDASGKEHKCDAGALSGMLKRQHVRIG